jgi:hypothetical protein
MVFLNKLSERKKELIFVLLIISAGVFFRAYKFSDWLHFEIDQVYDIDSISAAVDSGIGNLPLLGTNAGGGSLRLGPVFYYMEYLSAEIFGHTPPGYAAFVPILSIFSLPLFYLFSRRYFSVKISLALLAVFSFSVYFIQYSRFAWSPNILPFFIPLSFYALFRSVSSSESRKNLWFLFSVASITICTQIHFNSLLVVPAVAIIFLLIKRPHFSLKTWILSIGIILFLYSPMIIHEAKTDAQNSRYFLHKVDKVSKAKNTFFHDVVLSARYNALEFFLAVSGRDAVNNSQDGNLDECRNCLSNNIFVSAGWLYFIGSLFALIFLFRGEKDGEKKNFLILSALWFFISWGLYFYLIKSGYTMQARFAIISAPLAIIFLGFLAKALKLDEGKRFYIFVLIIFALLALNGIKVKSIFSQLGSADTKKARIEQEDIFPNTGRITLEQQYEILDYLKSKFSQNDYPVFLESNRNEYEATFWYHLNRFGIVNYGSIDEKNLCAEANYFLVKTTSGLRGMETYFDILETRDFGTLIVYQLNPKKEKITCEKPGNLEQHFTDPEIKAQEMLTWRKAILGL